MHNRIKRLSDRGIIVVWLALGMLFVLLALAGIAIDGSYLYYVKNQLQVAADAAALAGAGAGLSGTDTSGNLTQGAARQAAWTFACKNTADQSNPDPGGSNNNVYLVTNSSLDCNTPPSAANLNSGNDPGGDIVVGYWTLTKPSDACGSACSSAWEQAGAGFFCPATGSTTCSINAVKAVARRTGDAPMPNIKFGGNPVRLFLGQIMRLIGANWSFMNVTASAIAGPNQLPIGATPICLPSCALATPLNGQWGYNKNAPALVPPIPEGFTASDNVRLCADTDITSAPFGQEFYLQPSNDEDRPGFAWTNFDLTDLTVCDDKAKCGTNPNPGDIVPYITGAKQPPPVCGKAICITNGSATGPVLNTLATEVAKHNGDSHQVGETSINGWLLTLPVVLDCAEKQSCPGDPQGRPYPVQRFATVIITDVISSGDDDKKGIRLVGLNNIRTITYTCEGKTQKDPNVTRTRIVSTIGDASGNCPLCSSPPPSGGGGTAKLVK